MLCLAVDLEACKIESLELLHSSSFCTDFPTGPGLCQRRSTNCTVHINAQSHFLTFNEETLENSEKNPTLVNKKQKMENGKKNSKKLKWGVWKSKGNIGKEIQNELKLAKEAKKKQKPSNFS